MARLGWKVVNSVNVYDSTVIGLASDTAATISRGGANKTRRPPPPPPRARDRAFCSGAASLSSHFYFAPGAFSRE